MCGAGSHILDKKQTPRIAGEKAATMLLHTLGTTVCRLWLLGLSLTCRAALNASASGGCAGEYLTDQLIIFMALAKGTWAANTASTTTV